MEVHSVGLRVSHGATGVHLLSALPSGPCHTSLHSESCRTPASLSFIVVQSLGHVPLLWPHGPQPARPALSKLGSLVKFLSTESVMLPNHLIHCAAFLLSPSAFPGIMALSSELDLHIWWPKDQSSGSASVLSMNFQGSFPLGLTGLISLQSKGLSRVFSSTTFSFLVPPTKVTESQLIGSACFSCPSLCQSLWLEGLDSSRNLGCASEAAASKLCGSEPGEGIGSQGKVGSWQQGEGL